MARCQLERSGVIETLLNACSRRSLWTRSGTRRNSIRIHCIRRCFTKLNVIAKSGQFNNDPVLGPIRVPGHGRALDHPCHSRDMASETALEDNPNLRLRAFAHGFSSWMQPTRNLVRELHMLKVMDTLTDKARWKAKVFDNEIMARWKQEATSLPGKLISDKAWEWIANELRWKAEQYSRQGYVTTLETEATIVKGDDVISEALREEMKELVRPLMDVEEGLKDWHPGSDGKVLNLVHPSLYPVVYGRTKILTESTISLTDFLAKRHKDGETMRIPDPPEKGIVGPHCHRSTGSIAEPEYWSTQFQWSPCDVEFIGLPVEGVKIVSYINNLHPVKHMQLYTAIEKVVASSIQPWNEVLRWSCKSGNLLRIRQEGLIMQTPPPPDDLCNAIADLEFGETSNSEKTAQAVKDYLLLHDNPDRLPIAGESSDQPAYPCHSLDEELQGEWWNMHDWQDEIQTKWKKIRVTEHPDAGDVNAFNAWKDSRLARTRPQIEEMFRDSGLQIIVKLSSIELTPEKPEYNGGEWHLEGKMNEHIVATSIYYYDVENVTENRIQFRQEAQMDTIRDVKYEIENHSPVEEAYGIGDVYDAPAVQDIGSVVTRQGRLLVFPNIVQHRVEPFRLRDSSKPGHRRFLVIWLVDPHFRLVSSRNVLPQQWEWWKEKATKEGGCDTMVFTSDNTGLMKREEAEQLRLRLMEERTRVMENVHNHVEFYNFCEH